MKIRLMISKFFLADRQPDGLQLRRIKQYLVATLQIGLKFFIRP